MRKTISILLILAGLMFTAVEMYGQTQQIENFETTLNETNQKNTELIELMGVLIQDKNDISDELETEKAKPPVIKTVTQEVIEEAPAGLSKADYCKQLADSWRLTNKTSGYDANAVEGLAQTLELRCKYGQKADMVIDVR